MAINFTQLEALIRLANNNPSEHEANTAARKVCRLLAEYKFTRNTVRAEPKSQPYNPQRPPQYGQWEASNFTQEMYDELLRKMREEQKRQKETEQRYQESWNNPYREYKQRRREVFMRQCTRCKTQFMGLSPTEDICPRCRYGTYKESVYGTWNSPPKNGPEKKPRQCSKCGHTKMTMRITNVFICNECQWNEFKEKENDDSRS